MNIDNIDRVRKLIADKESGRVELKETTGQPERGMETLCAFVSGGVVEPLYPESPKHPKQKCHLTEKGKERLNQQ